MGSANSSNLTVRYLPQALGWTAAVTLIPLAAVWELRASGTTSSPWACIPLAVALSLAITALGGTYWRRRTPAPELLFSELMRWGFYRRVRSARSPVQPRCCRIRATARSRILDPTCVRLGAIVWSPMRSSADGLPVCWSDRRCRLFHERVRSRHIASALTCIRDRQRRCVGVGHRRGLRHHPD
jgi:hypothetical protein